MNGTTPDYSLDGFFRETVERPGSSSTFEKAADRLLRINVNGGVWLRPGAAVAYRGEIRFERRPTLEARSVTDAAMREMSPLVRARGQGRLFCGHHGWHVQVICLRGETLFVSSEELLAFEDSLEFEPTLVNGGISIAAGGLVVVRLSGHGSLAIAAHGTPLTLPITPESSLSTDPHATLAWSGSLMPSLKTDLTWRTAIRHGGHESVQMRFEGTGFVVVQPFEDARRLAPPASLLRRLVSFLPGL
jgi:uncharacterized protein (AIM24 family)